MPAADRFHDSFERIYSTDLVYRKDCWKLCGDAHCCNFNRYKSQFKLIRSRAQELPLLPGEFEFLQHKGWLAQFGDYEHKVIDYAAGPFVFNAESIVSARPGGCVCDHGTRPTICRLYPLLPVFRFSKEVGREVSLASVERAGIYEELEKVAELQPACQLDHLPFDQLSKFLQITEALAANPEHLLYLEAYRLTKAHIADRVAERYHQAAARGTTVFQSFEFGLLRQQLVDHSKLEPALRSLAQAFADRFGDAVLNNRLAQPLTE